MPTGKAHARKCRTAALAKLAAFFQVCVAAWTLHRLLPQWLWVSVAYRGAARGNVTGSCYPAMSAYWRPVGRQQPSNDVSCWHRSDHLRPCSELLELVGLLRNIRSSARFSEDLPTPADAGRSCVGRGQHPQIFTDPNQRAGGRAAEVQRMLRTFAATEKQGGE